MDPFRSRWARWGGAIIVRREGSCTRRRDPGGSSRRRLVGHTGELGRRHVAHPYATYAIAAAAMMTTASTARAIKKSRAGPRRTTSIGIEFLSREPGDRPSDAVCMATLPNVVMRFSWTSTSSAIRPPPSSLIACCPVLGVAVVERPVPALPEEGEIPPSRLVRQLCGYRGAERPPDHQCDPHRCEGQHHPRARARFPYPSCGS